MSINSFKASGFRCLSEVSLELDPKYNLIHGANASGKTSLLEALAYLGRGKSFRGASATSLIQHGNTEFVLFGRVRSLVREVSLGVCNARGKLEIRIDGESGRGLADLAEALPLQIIDPEVHRLVAGGPEDRRRFVDWLVFHVKREYLDVWRRFRRTLRQRNALLRQGAGDREIASWDREFIELAMRIDALRAEVLDRSIGPIEAVTAKVLGGPVSFGYERGWSADKSIADQLAVDRDRDARLGSTQHGPHRADLRLHVSQRQARRLVSRGQQKLLASGMIIAATAVVQAQTDKRLLVLLDDPAAELDDLSLARLLGGAYELESQLIVTSLDRNRIEFPVKSRVFHVEQGELTLETG